VGLSIAIYTHKYTRKYIHSSYIKIRFSSE